MLKKAKAGMESGDAGDGASLSQSVLKSSHQIWLAGLGAFAKAQTGGVKVFEALVEAGGFAGSQDAARRRPRPPRRHAKPLHRKPRRCTQWQAEHGTSWSRCFRSAWHAPSANSVCIHRRTSSG